MNEALTILIIVAAGATASLLALAVGLLLRRSRHRMAAQLKARPALRKQLAGSGLLRLGYPLLHGLAGPLGAVTPRRLMDEWNDLARRAGRPAGLAGDEFIALAALIGVAAAGFIGGGLFLLAPSSESLLGLCMVIAGPLLVYSSLRARAEAREHHVQMALPYVLDLLVLTLRTGTSLNLALRRVAADYATHPLGHEIDQTLSEIEVGAPRREALARLGERTSVPEMVTLVETINQAQDLGWPMADTLERLAEGMNTNRVVKAQDSAGRAGSLVMIPAMLVMGSAVLLIFGPMIVRILRGDLALS